MNMDDEIIDEDFPIDLDFRKAVHSEGFFLADEIKEDENGDTWVNINFFDWLKTFLKSMGLTSEDDIDG